MRRITDAPGLAPAVGPFSQAVVANGFVFVTGQLPSGPGGLGDQPADFEAQVQRTLENLEAVLKEAGSGLEHVVKCNGYLTSAEQLEPYNRVYGEFFGEHGSLGGPGPARTTVCVTLWGVALEIDCVAVVP